jgi:hypothetical protein
MGVFADMVKAGTLLLSGLPHERGNACMTGEARHTHTLSLSLSLFSFTHERWPVSWGREYEFGAGVVSDFCEEERQRSE